MKKVIYILIASISLISIFLIGLTYNLDKVLIKEKVYFYSGLQKQEFDEIKLKNKNGETSLESRNEEISLESNPIYYLEGIKMILPKDMAIVNSQDGSMNKIVHFSQILKKDAGTYLIENSKERLLQDFFLYDGKDTYVFFDPIKIYNGEMLIEIEPFSYVKLINNGNMIEIYSKYKDKFEVIDVDESKLIAVSNYGYTLDLKLGSLKTSIGEQLLFKDIDALKKY